MTVANALLAARALVAVIFVVAGLAKLADREGVRSALAEFGVSRTLLPAGAFVLPVSELAVAAALVPATTARVGAGAALGLLVVFCLAIARVLAQGRRPDCGCFGRALSTQVSAGTLVRNAILGALAAAVAAAGPGESLGRALAGVEVDPAHVAWLVVALALVLQGWFGRELFRQNRRLLDRVRTLEEGAGRSPEPDGLPIGEPAPSFVLGRANGRRGTLDDLLEPGLPLALVFSDSGCAACAELAPHLDLVREDAAGTLELALVEDDRDALEAYRVHRVPSAVIVDPGGWIASETVTGRPAIEELLASAAAPTMERLRVAVG